MFSCICRAPIDPRTCSRSPTPSPSSACMRFFQTFFTHKNCNMPQHLHHISSPTHRATLWSFAPFPRVPCAHRMAPFVSLSALVLSHQPPTLHPRKRTRKYRHTTPHLISAHRTWSSSCPDGDTTVLSAAHPAPMFPRHMQQRLYAREPHAATHGHICQSRAELSPHFPLTPHLTSAHRTWSSSCPDGDTTVLSAAHPAPMSPRHMQQRLRAREPHAATHGHTFEALAFPLSAFAGRHFPLPMDVTCQT